MLQGEFDVVHPVIGRISQKAPAFTLETSEQIPELASVCDARLRDPCSGDHEGPRSARVTCKHMKLVKFAFPDLSEGFYAGYQTGR